MIAVVSLNNVQPRLGAGILALTRSRSNSRGKGLFRLAVVELLFRVSLFRGLLYTIKDTPKKNKPKSSLLLQNNINFLQKAGGPMHVRFQLCYRLSLNKKKLPIE